MHFSISALALGVPEKGSLLSLLGLPDTKTIAVLERCRKRFTGFIRDVAYLEGARGLLY